MIAHQAIRMNLAVEVCGQLLQMKQVKQVVVVPAKTGRAIVAALDNMNSHLGKNETSLPRH
jgi:hypothetical protein